MEVEDWLGPQSEAVTQKLSSCPGPSSGDPGQYGGQVRERETAGPHCDPSPPRTGKNVAGETVIRQQGEPDDS